jgi:hypothetical protein
MILIASFTLVEEMVQVKQAVMVLLKCIILHWWVPGV